MRLYFSISFLAGFLFSTGVSADELRIAVASNFSITLKKLSADFEKKTGYKLITSAGSTGKLFAQIVHGAPYDIFLSADAERADLLVTKNLAKQSRIYAQGKLIFIANDKSGKNCRSVLDQALNHLSIANPKTAPYGTAAKQVLLKLGKWEQLKNNLVVSENIAQAYQYVVSGNADAGLIAASLIVNSAENKNYCQWDVPGRLHDPIRQKMVMLNHALKNVAAKAFFNYMKSASAKRIILENGYIL